MTIGLAATGMPEVTGGGFRVCAIGYSITFNRILWVPPYAMMCKQRPLWSRLREEDTGGDEVDVLVDEWMTVDEAASYLKVSRRTLYRWMENGEVPYFELAAGVVPRRIRRRDLGKLMEAMN